MGFIQMARVLRKNAKTRNSFLRDEAPTKLLYPALKNNGEKWTMSV